MKIAFIGCGKVGGPLADHLQRLGHTVVLAANDPNSPSVLKAMAKNPDLAPVPPGAAIADAEVVFLATPYDANRAALEAVADELRGKILVDCTNPVEVRVVLDEGDQNHVVERGADVRHGLASVESGSQVIQKLLPQTKVVKAFTIYGFENFEDSSYPGYDVRPVMMFCGDDADAKKVVAGLIAQLGWEPLDVGGLAQALHLEHMTLLWTRMVRFGDHSPNMVWAVLRR